MNKKLVLPIVIVLVLGLVIAALALNGVFTGNITGNVVSDTGNTVVGGDTTPTTPTASTPTPTTPVDTTVRTFYPYRGGGGETVPQPINPISVSGGLTQLIGLDNNQGLGTPIVISNNGDTEGTVILSSVTEDGMSVSYVQVGELELTQKTEVCSAEDSSSDCWTHAGDKAMVYYTIVGDEFNYRIESTDITPSEYTLVYYPNPSPAYDSASYTGNVIKADDIDKSLPYIGDLNAVGDEYCTNGQNPPGSNCNGAKLWLVPNDAFSSPNVVDWSKASTFLFETDLISYQFTEETTVTITVA